MLSNLRIYCLGGMLTGCSHGWALAVDSLGNKKWEWEANETEVPYRGIMSMQYDSLYREWVYVSSLKKSVYVVDLEWNVEMSVPILVRRDSSMNLTTYTEYGPYSYNAYLGSLESDYNGGWVAAGIYSCLNEESPYDECYVNSGRVVKLSDDGALEWSVIDSAFYNKELGSRSYLSGVTASPSGSIYAVGWANNYDENHVYRSYGWLLKITADGCVDTLCTTTSLIDQINARLNPVKVYPNPASDHVIFEITDDSRDLHADVFDLQGRRLSTMVLQSGVNVMMLDERYASGMYVWRVVDRKGTIYGSGKVVVARG